MSVKNTRKERKITWLVCLIIAIILFVYSRPSKEYDDFKAQHEFDFEVSIQNLMQQHILEWEKELEKIREEETVVENVHKEITHNSEESISRQKEESPTRGDYSRRELELLAKIIHTEARGESMEGQMAVAEVVINRANHISYPNSIEKVIFQPNQFCGTKVAAWNHNPNESCWEAAERVLNGERVFGRDDIVYFYAPKYSNGFSGFNFYKQIGVHAFGYQ